MELAELGPSPFPERLRQRRMQVGISQLTLAERIGCSVGAVLAWEGGMHYPSVLALTAICRVLGVSCDWMLGLQDGDAAYEARWKIGGEWRCRYREKTTMEEAVEDYRGAIENPRCEEAVLVRCVEDVTVLERFVRKV